MTRVFGRLWRATGGVAAIEFAVVALPFLALILVIFETSLIFLTEYVMESSLASAARMIRTGQVQAQGLTKSQLKTLVCDKMEIFLDCESKLYVDVRSFTAFSDIAGGIPAASVEGEVNPAIANDDDGSGFQPGGATQVVVARAFYDWELIVPQLSKLGTLNGNRRLIAVGTAFRNEPFP